MEDAYRGEAPPAPPTGASNAEVEANNAEVDAYATAQTVVLLRNEFVDAALNLTAELTPVIRHLKAGGKTGSPKFNSESLGFRTNYLDLLERMEKIRIARADIAARELSTMAGDNVLQWQKALAAANNAARNAGSPEEAARLKRRRRDAGSV